MRRSIRPGETVSIVSGVAASAKRRSDAGPVVVSWVRSDRMQAIKTRKGSRSRSATTASAVGFQRGALRRSRRITASIATARRPWARVPRRARTSRTLAPDLRPVNLDSPGSVGDPPRVTLLRALAVVCVAGWLGIMAFFSFEVAPVVFRTIDRTIAGQAVAAVIPRYYGWGLALSAIALVASVIQVVSGRAGRIRPLIGAALCGLMVTMLVLASTVIAPRAETARRS